MSEPEASPITQRITVRNRGPETLRFILEPWAEEFELPPGEVFEVEGVSNTPGEFEIEVGERTIVVYGWTGSIARVLHKGREITPWNGPPPAVQNAAAFLRRVLGGKP